MMEGLGVSGTDDRLDMEASARYLDDLEEDYNTD